MTSINIWDNYNVITFLVAMDIFQFLRISKFSGCLKFIQIVILWVCYTIPFGFTLFWHFWAYLNNLLNYFLWLRITDEGSVPEMRIWSISLIKSDLKWCIHLSISLLFNYNYLVSVTAGGPRSPRGHMWPSSAVDFGWVVAFWEHQIFRVFKMYSNCDFVGLLHHPFWLYLVLALLGIPFQHFKLLSLAKDHWRGFSTRNAHMVHIVN